MTTEDTAAYGAPQATEREWNEKHGLTATCPVCGGAMKPQRTLCSWACWHRSRSNA